MKNKIFSTVHNNSVNEFQRKINLLHSVAAHWKLWSQPGAK